LVLVFFYLLVFLLTILSGGVCAKAPPELAYLSILFGFALSVVGVARA
jgi:hypothetical protein